jgi:uncharacterized SAM-binding protein YcdF (DUF218 family)
MISAITPIAIPQARTQVRPARVRWLEDRSRTTQNAQRAEILHAAGIERVVLVAHTFDMLGASAEFADIGIEIVPAATGARDSEPYTLLGYLPSMPGLRAKLLRGV